MNHTYVVLVGHHAYNITQSAVLKDDCACLNNVFDEIFVISIPDRMNTLTLTLFQLNDANISYHIWEGHSSNSQNSIHLWNRFRRSVNKSTKNTKYLEKVNNAYHNKYVFFLRQTQMDIIKYSKKYQLNKILIIEDDILLANPYYINLFCKVEPSLPKWYVLNLGVNQYPSDGQTSIALLNITNFECEEIKYMIKNDLSYGTFGIAISFKMYSHLLTIFDKELNLYPLDSYERFISDDSILQKCLNIHPTLMLPDVTKSTLREPRDETEFIETQTTDHNRSHFSKYWHLRFQEKFDKLVINSPSQKLTYGCISILICKTISYDDINGTMFDINVMSLVSFNETHNISIDWIIFIWQNKTYMKMQQLINNRNIENYINIKLIYGENRIKHYFWQRYLKPSYIQKYMNNNYDYVWLMDGDITINEMNWKCFWYMIHEVYKPKIFQPSIVYKDDYYPEQWEKYERITLYPLKCHTQTAASNKIVQLFGYETSFIEIQTPIFTFDAWSIFITEFNKKFNNDSSNSDWGMDRIWCGLINDKLLHQNKHIIFNKTKQNEWNEETCDIVYNNEYMNDVTDKPYNIPCMIVQAMPVRHYNTKTHPVHHSNRSDHQNIHHLQQQYIKQLFSNYWIFDHNVYYRAFPIQLSYQCKL